jgi:SAM-dependent methyltransferase
VTDGYGTTDPLRARIAIHGYGTNPVSWYDFVRARLPPAKTLLDAGAGTGALWPGGRPGLVTTDLSAAMCAAQRAAGLTTVTARAEALPFRDAAYDGALACHVLYHLADPAAGLRELHRVVRPGGWVAVATNGTGHMAEVSALAVRAGLPAADVHEHFPAEQAPEALAELFDDVVVHPYEDTLVVPDAAPVVAYVASFVGRPLTADQERRATPDRLPLRIGKHTVLVTARRP